MDPQIRIPASALAFATIEKASSFGWAGADLVDRDGERVSMMVMEWRRLVGALVALGFTVFESPAWPNMLGVARARDDIQWSS